jgi:flagellin
MGMRIRTNVSSLTAQRFSEQNTESMGKSFEKLSSGYRINRSADDAAGLAVSENLRAKVRGLHQARRNANDAVSMVQIAEGGMNEMNSILIRLRELTVQASSDTIGDKERGFLNREYTQLVDELDRIAQTAEFNGLQFFNTDKTEFVIQVGVNNSEPEVNRDTLTIDLSGIQFTSESLGLGKEDEIGPRDEGGAGAPDRQSISQKLDTIDSALLRVSSERATLGAVQNRLGSAISNLGISMENMSAARSRIADVDYASEVSELTKSRILAQASTSVLGQANVSQDMALALLR